MGNYRARRPGFITAWKMEAANLMFQGLPDKEITKRMASAEYRACGDDDALKKKLYHKWRNKLNNLRKDPTFQEYYQSLVTEWRVHAFGPSLKKLREQVDSPEPWLANKAANDVLNRIGRDPFSDGKDDSAVVIKFEGMPELGSPETEEPDG